MPAEIIKKGKSGRYYRKTTEGWVPTEAPSAPQSAGPPSSGAMRDFAEGASVVGGKLVDAFNSFPLAMGYTGPTQYAPIKDVQNAADTISAATADNPTRMRVAGEGAANGALALPFVAATGGLTVPVAVSNVVGGIGGALSSDQARRSGYGPLGQAVAGFAGDLGVGGLTRGAFEVPGMVNRALSPSYKAGEYVIPLELGAETSDDAADALSQAYDKAAKVEDRAWDAQRAYSTPATTSSAPFHTLAAQQANATDLNPVDLPAISKRIPDVLEPDIGVDRIQDVLHNVSSIQRATEPTDVAKRLAGQYRTVADQALDSIEQLSASDAKAVDALRRARKASSEFHAAFPDDSALYRQFISENAPDDTQKAFVALLGSKKAETEMGLVKNALQGNTQALRGLRQSVVQAVLGDSEELASAAPTAALRRLDKYEDAARVALGDDGFDHFRRLLSEGATANRNRPWSVLGALGRGNVPGAASGASVGAAVAGPVGAGVGTAVGTGISELMHRLSPRAIREIAIRSLYDPDLYRQITTRVPHGVKAAEWAATLTGTLVRRGILTKAEASGASEDGSR